MTTGTNKIQLCNEGSIASFKNLAVMNKLGNNNAQELASASNDLVKQNYESMKSEAESTQSATNKDAQRMMAEGIVAGVSACSVLATGVASGMAAKGFPKEEKEIDDLRALLNPTNNAKTTLGATVANDLNKPKNDSDTSKIVTEDLKKALINSKGFDSNNQVLQNEGFYKVKDGKLVQDPNKKTRLSEVRLALEKETAAAQKDNFTKAVEKTIKQKSKALQQMIDARRSAIDIGQRTSDAAGRAGQAGVSSAITGNQSQDQKEATMFRNSQSGVNASIQGLEQTRQGIQDAQKRAAEQTMNSIQALNRG